MADSSFDIVSKFDRQEVDNALGQAAREISTRFDFKGTGALIEWKGDDVIEITASADDRASAVLDVFQQKLIKRDVSLKILDASDPRQSGHGQQDRHQPQGGHLLRGRQEGRQADPRRGPQGRQGADPGRRAARLVEEARRPPGRPGPGQGPGLRLRGAVHQLPVKISIAAALASFHEQWQPHRLASVNDHDVKIARIQGEFVWHTHPNSDELFLVVSGEMTLQLRDGDVVLGPNEIYVVPAGVEHCPGPTTRP